MAIKSIFPKEFENILSVVAAFNSSVEPAGDHGVSLGVNVVNKKDGKVYKKVCAVQLNHKPADVMVDGKQYEDTSYKNYLLNSLALVDMGIDGEDLQDILSSVIDEKVTDYKVATDVLFDTLLTSADLGIVRENVVAFTGENIERIDDLQISTLNDILKKVDQAIVAKEAEEERY